MCSMGQTVGNAYKSSLILALAISAAVGVSVSLTYYHTIVLQDYQAFIDPETVPEASDFIAYLATEVASYLQR